MRPRVVSVNEAGHVIGQDHPRTKLSDHDVWLIHELIAAGLKQRDIAAKFDVSVDTVKAVSCGRRRGQVAVGQKRLPAAPPRPRVPARRVREFCAVLAAALLQRAPPAGVLASRAGVDS